MIFGEKCRDCAELYQILCTRIKLRKTSTHLSNTTCSGPPGKPTSNTVQHFFEKRRNGAELLSLLCAGIKVYETSTQFGNTARSGLPNKLRSTAFIEKRPKRAEL